jgi:hypothetical protein
MSNLLWSTYVYQHRTFWSSCITLSRVLFGELSVYAEWEVYHPTLAPVFASVYLVSIYLVLINVFLAILTDTYSRIASDDALAKDDEFGKALLKLRHAIARLFARVRGKKYGGRGGKNPHSERRTMVRLESSGALERETVSIPMLEDDVPPGHKHVISRLILKYDNNPAGHVPRQFRAVFLRALHRRANLTGAGIDTAAVVAAGPGDDVYVFVVPFFDIFF